LIIGAKATLLALLAIWGATFIFASVQSNRAGESFLHLVSLPFHEAGRIIFSPLGRFMQVLGGTLGLLKMDHLLAWLAQAVGILLMAAALLWAAVNLWREYGALQAGAARRRGP
jgi:hypothetical protein